MAGHSKWKNIQHRKGKQDAKKAKIYTKLIRELSVAARLGSDPNSNSRLRLAVNNALKNNMTRDTVDRAIKRGAGGGEGAALEDIHYEGYGPGGVAVIVSCLTDNRNRTVGEVRHAFTKAGGNLGTEGSVSYLFKQQGLICFPPKSDEDKIMQLALEAGADDVTTNDDGSIDVITSPDTFENIKKIMEQNGLKPEDAEVTMLAGTQVKLDKDTAEKVVNLIDALEDLDDVQNVYTNAEFPDDL